MLTPSAEATALRLFLARASTILCLLTLAGMLLAGCSGQRLPTYRYRLTVEVDTLDGLRTGSGVIEVRSYDAGEHGALYKWVKGEAVAVDLPNGQTLFVCLSQPTVGLDRYAGRFAMVAFDPPGKEYADRLKVLMAKKSTAVVPQDIYPMMVRFRDIRDSKTVEAVEPTNLAKAFGLGVSLRRMTVRITNKPVTRGIENRLRWLPTLYNGGTVGQGSDIDRVREENNLSHSEFSFGIKS